MPDSMILYGKYDGYKAIHSIINDDDNFFDAVFAVSQTAEKYSLSGNVIKAYLALLMMNDENPFSLSCEKREMQKGGAYSLALSDAEILRNAYFYDFKNSSHCGTVKKLQDYTCTIYK